MRSWPTGAWIGVGAVAIALTVAVWLRLRTGSESAVQVIRPAHRSARVEDRLNQLRADWASHGEQKEPAGEIRERKAPQAQMPAPPTAPAVAEHPSEDLIESGSDNPTAALDAALSQDEPDFNALKQVATSDPDPQNRLTAVMLLGTMEDAEAVPVLAQALKDSDADVRLMAVQALGDFTGPESAQAVEIALNDPSPEIRFEALSVLADIGGEVGRAAVRRAANDEDEDVRALAQGLLGMDEATADATPSQ